MEPTAREPVATEPMAGGPREAVAAATEPAYEGVDTEATAESYDPRLRTLFLLGMGCLSSAFFLRAAMLVPEWLTALVTAGYLTGCLSCALASLPLAAPTLPKSSGPWIQTIWYVLFIGWCPVLAAFSVGYLHQDLIAGATCRSILHGILLGLLVMSAFFIWAAASDIVGKLGLQPLTEAGWASWSPPGFLVSTIGLIVFVYTCTHLLRGVETSVEASLDPVLRTTYWTLAALWLSSYVRILMTEPGRAPPDRFLPRMAPDATWTYCSLCKVCKPQRCRHCTKCDSCVLKMDHHCPWLRRCIGYENYKYFLVFLFYSVIALLFKAGTLLLFIAALWQQDLPIGSMFVLLFVAVLVLKLAAVLAVFFGFHMYLVSHGMTTVEYLIKKHNGRSERFDYNQSTFCNFQLALGSNPLTWCLPLWPPDGDGLSFQYTLLADMDEPVLIERSSKSSGLARGYSSLSRQEEPEKSTPCIESTEDPTCLENQHDTCIDADTAGLQLQDASVSF